MGMNLSKVEIELKRFVCIAWHRLKLLLLLGILLGNCVAQAQLAVTEAMAWPSTNQDGVLNSDFWELTNYGTNAINLAGYLFCDADKVFPEQAWRLPNIAIAPGESIIFVRGDGKTPDAAAFRQWWGETNLPPGLQIVFYPNYPTSYGFDERGDAVRLWDANSNVVDRADFGETVVRGVTFTSDALGRFGVPSRVTECRGFRSAEYTNDIGSPGYAPCGPLPLQITRQPESQTVDPGMSVTLPVEGVGLPRPKYQWYFNGTALSNAQTTADIVPAVINFAGCGLAWEGIPKAKDLTIVNVQPVHAGQYFAVLSNGLERLTSAVVTVTVNTNPLPPQIVCPPTELLFPSIGGEPQTNLMVSPWQTANFAVLARGYPMPKFQWSWSADGTNFANVPGATNRTLVIPFVQNSHSGIYRVRMSNPVGTTNAYAALSVKAKPRLKITEVMPQSNSEQHHDWFEITNLDGEPVNLYGYRWDDGPGSIGGGPTITNTIIMQPGESVIFMESQTPNDFIRWWGADNLPAGLQFVIYGANGLSEQSDEIVLWNPTATADDDFIDSVGFSAATWGASFWFAPEDPDSEFGVPSVEGQCGAFRAAEGGEVGSPGWTPWVPRLTSVRREGSVVTLSWKAQPGSTNRLQYTRNLVATNQWFDLGTFTFSGPIGTSSHTNTESQCFYRVLGTAPDDWHCK